MNESIYSIQCINSSAQLGSFCCSVTYFTKISKVQIQDDSKDVMFVPRFRIQTEAECVVSHFIHWCPRYHT